MPQDDHVLQDLPETNQPPRIVEESVSPQPRIVNTDLACGEIAFTAAVEDPDLGDLLTVQWYVSDLSNTTPTQPFQQGAITNPTGQAIRKDAAALTVNFSASRQPLTAGLHVVELLVSDGTVINRVPQPRDVPLDGGTGTLTFASTYAWVVNVTDTGVCP